MDMEKIETQLKRLSPELSMHESQVLWSRVESHLLPRGSRVPQKSKRPRSLFRAITAGLVIVGLLGGSVVTAYASEALPGDTLYGAKITIERAQIVLAPIEKKKDLQLAFADRRVKEVAVVLADIEEDSVGPTDPTLMAVSAPSPEVATMAFALPAEEDPSADMLAMKVVPLTLTMEADTENEGDAQKEKDSASSLTGETDRAKVVMPMNVSLTEDTPIPARDSVKQEKRWKNIEKKKKALTVAIKELERSREELRKSGATTTSQNVEVVIMNLTELNKSGTTPDQMFVEKAKNSEIDVVDVEDKDDPRSNDDESGREEDGEDRGSSDSSRSTDGRTQGAAVFLSDDREINEEAEQEVQEVKVRNTERRKRNKEDNRRTVIREKTEEEKRIPICFDVSGRKEELLVLKERRSWYIDKGFTEGKCESVKAPADTSALSDKVSQEEEKGIIEE